MSRRAYIYCYNIYAGELIETDRGYRFQYDPQYLDNANAKAISLTMPLRTEPYTDNVLLPFFDGLIPEGWLLDITADNWKLDARDRMGILLAACQDCIGAVHVESTPPEHDHA